MTWFRITLNSRTKIFHISNTRTEFVPYTLSNLTSNPYAAARKMAKEMITTKTTNQKGVVVS